MLEGERADEQAHGEADAAQDRDAVELRHVAPAAGRDAEHDQQRTRAEDADLLAEEQARRDAERQRRGEPRQRQAGERQAGVGEGEQRQDANADPRIQHMLQPIAAASPSVWRRRASAGCKASTTPASVACTPDFSTHTQRQRPEQQIGRRARARRAR